MDRYRPGGVAEAIDDDAVLALVEPFKERPSADDAVHLVALAVQNVDDAVEVGLGLDTPTLTGLVAELKDDLRGGAAAT